MLCEGSWEPVIHLCLRATHSYPSNIILPYLHFSSLPPPSSDQTIIWNMAINIDILGGIVLHLMYMYMYMWLTWFHWLSGQTKHHLKYGHEHKDTLGEIICCISCTCGWHVSIDCLGPDGTVQLSYSTSTWATFQLSCIISYRTEIERNKIDNVFYLFDFLYETKAGPIIQYTV